MIELAFVACLNTSPTSCDDKALQFMDVSMMSCIMGAQPQLAKWVNEHPGWEIHRWTCQPIGSKIEI
jgi:hypothetical protein